MVNYMDGSIEAWPGDNYTHTELTKSHHPHSDMHLTKHKIPFLKNSLDCCRKELLTACFTWVSKQNWSALGACFSCPEMCGGGETSGRCTESSSTSQCMWSTLVFMRFATWRHALSSNCLHQSFTVASDTRAMPYTACICKWISASWQFSAQSEWITAG